MIEISLLPTLSFKVGPNLFDLSTQLHAVSIRDQMHRGTALAEALVAGKQVDPGEDVLIVGAGVAGISAGIVLARQGVDVQIIETAAQPFSLQRNINTRSIGPYMYEWPLPVFDSQELPPLSGAVLEPWADQTPPLSFTRRDPDTPASLVGQWDTDLRDALRRWSSLRLQTNIDSHNANQQIKDWLRNERMAFSAGRGHRRRSIAIHSGNAWEESQEPKSSIAPRVVILAAGMGIERNEIKLRRGRRVSLGTPFWADDKLLDLRCGWPINPKVVILGGGDGALQDALRALTRHAHPLKTLAALRLHPVASEIIAPTLHEISALETQHAQVSMWASTSARAKRAVGILDGAYKELAKGLATETSVRTAVFAQLRVDVESVTLCIRESHFSKAYSLNRFLVHLIEQCILATPGDVYGSVQFSVRRNVACVYARGGAMSYRLGFNDRKLLEAHIVAVRFGPDPSQLPWQWLGLNTMDTVNRQDLAAIPLPLYMPPSH